MSNSRRTRRAEPQRVQRRKLRQFRAHRNELARLRGRGRWDDGHLGEPDGEEETDYGRAYDGRVRWGRQQRDCPCCDTDLGFRFGLARPGGAIELELATLQLLRCDGRRSVERELADFHTALAAMPVSPVHRSPPWYALPARQPAAGALSEADLRVVAWYESLATRPAESLLAEVAAQPREAAAFGALRGRVVSSMRSAPLAQRCFDLDFDVERAALLALLTFPMWRQPLAEWRGGSAVDLLRHLLAPRIAMPALFAVVVHDRYCGPRPQWVAEGALAEIAPRELAADPLLWLVAEAHGASVRRIARAFGERLPSALVATLCALTDRVDGFEGDPRDASTMEALFERAAIQRLGGSDVEWRRVWPFYLRDPADRRQALFWNGAVAWLARQREALGDEEARRIVAWAHHRFAEDARFSLVGRSRAAVLAQTAAYELALARQARAAREAALTKAGRERASWAALGLSLRWCDTARENWNMRELTDELALAEEGAVQRHCVALYAAACHAGAAAIFQLRCGDARLLTVELRLPERRVVQARGRFNAAPSPEALTAMRHWAAHFGLELGEFL